MSHMEVLDSVELELLHVNIRADKHTSTLRTVGIDALTDHATVAVRRYLHWLCLIADRRDKLIVSATKLQFPHEHFRHGQRDMAAAVFRAARDGASLMCEAPTGTGKTISTLFPASKILAEGDIKQIIYLTAKVGGRLSAAKSLKQLQNSGLELCAVQIRAKQATCFCSNGRCERDESGRCPMTLGFYERLPAAMEELLRLGVIDSEQLDEIAWQHQLCPFELALQMLPWMHVVVADFNYVFDPLVRLPHFAEARKDSVLLIDEAHNLVDRSRAMFSAELSRQQCRRVSTECRQSHKLVAESLERLSRVLLSHARELPDGENVTENANPKIAKSVSNAVESMVATMNESPSLPESGIDLFRQLCRYAAIHEVFHENHRCITHVSKAGKSKEIKIYLYCLDAAKALSRQYRLFKACILFSATLRPIRFYRDSLGLSNETAKLLLPSPFDSNRTLHAIVDWIDTRFRQREQSLSALANLIKSVTEGKTGNYLVFFPSYAYLNSAFEEFAKCSGGAETWRQTSDQSKLEQQELLDRLCEPGHRVGFAILGGVFGEGIDYLGNQLIGIIVVSTGLPGLATQTQLVADHYRQQGHDGYDFAYRYPGFTRVLQTVGRLIRSESDAGVVVLVDDRFRQSFYKTLYPVEWRMVHPGTVVKLRKEIDTFWKALSASG